MTLSVRRIAGPEAIVGGIETTIFTATERTLVQKAVVANLDTKSSHWSLSLVPAGDIAGNDNRLAKAVVIGARDTVLAEFGQIMEAGDFLSVLTPTSSTINVSITGVTGIT